MKAVILKANRHFKISQKFVIQLVKLKCSTVSIPVVDLEKEKLSLILICYDIIFLSIDLYLFAQ